MYTMKIYVSMFIVFFISIQLNAQEKTITGIVSDSSGLLPGVTVIVKGTSIGTQTDFDGKYSIKASVGDTLVFSFIGMVTIEKVIGTNSVINVVMNGDSLCLEEVVVTALGDKSSRKSLVPETKIILRGSSSISPKENQNIAGTLTAGEINDLEKWNEWRKLSKKEFEDRWEFHLKDKLKVIINDGNNNRLVNKEVFLYNNLNQLVCTSRTDSNGEAILFYNSRLNNKSKAYSIKVPFEDKVFGKYISKNINKVNLMIPSNSSVKNSVDIMFTIDATGSMGDEISYLKTELGNIIDRIDNQIKEKRLGLVFYRDKGDDYIVRDFDFTTDIEEVQNNLNSQYAKGGGDFEEAVEMALQVSLSKKWNKNAKARLLFLLLDAPPHFTKENVRIIKDQIEKAMRNGIKIIPIVASDADKELEFLMRFFSISTNGTYVFLTDDSGIGNSHLAPSTSEFEVEKLNDLIIRLIEKFTSTEV